MQFMYLLLWGLGVTSSHVLKAKWITFVISIAIFGCWYDKIQAMYLVASNGESVSMLHCHHGKLVFSFSGVNTIFKSLGLRRLGVLLFFLLNSFVFWAWISKCIDITFRRVNIVHALKSKAVLPFRFAQGCNYMYLPMLYYHVIYVKEAPGIIPAGLCPKLICAEWQCSFDVRFLLDQPLERKEWSWIAR